MSQVPQTGGTNTHGQSSSRIDQATQELKKLIEEATLAQLKSASEILPAKAVQSAVQGLPKQ